MTLDECIAYLENVSSERKPRSRKARQILRYLIELKKRRESEQCVCDKLQAELFDYDRGFLISNYEAGYDDGIKRAMVIISRGCDSDGRENDSDEY
jgi:hypothetical protein